MFCFFIQGLAKNFTKIYYMPMILILTNAIACSSNEDIAAVGCGIRVLLPFSGF